MPAEEQLPLWESVAADAWVPVSILTADRLAPLPSSVVAREFGGVQISRIDTGPQRVRREVPEDQIRAADRLFLNLPLTAGTWADQDGRRADLHAGDFAVVDASRSFELGFERPLRQISVAVAPELLLPRLDAVDGFTARRIDGRSGLGGVTSEMLRTLATIPGPLDAAGARALGRQVSELIALALGAAVPARAGRSRRLVMQAVLDEAERSVADESLTPRAVADAVGVSVRYLHRLFAEEGTTFGRWLLARRLARCHLDLHDPACAADTVTAICFRHGFTDRSHFARAYRAAYGMSPSAARLRPLR